MTRTWEDRGWPYTPALALALEPFLAFVVRVVLGSACEWQEARDWAVAIAVGAIAAHAYLVLIMTASGVWAVVQRREWCAHAAKLSAVQLGVGLYLTFGWFKARLIVANLREPILWLGLSSLAGCQRPPHAEPSGSPKLSQAGSAKVSHPGPPKVSHRGRPS